MATPDPIKPEDWDLWHLWMQAHRLLAQEVERRLQSAFGISKPDFSVLVTLLQAPGCEMRVLDLARSLAWEKGRVAHQLTRMERRGLVERHESGASGRRTGIAFTSKGRWLAERAIIGHADTVRSFFLDPLSPEQAASIRSWSEQMISRLGDTAAQKP